MNKVQNYNLTYSVNYVKLLDPGNVSQVKYLENELVKSRKERVDSLVESVTTIRGDLETLKSDIFRNLNKWSNNSDALKTKIFDTEGKITNLKETIEEELIILIKSEDSLLKELQYFEHRLNESYKPLKPEIHKPHKQVNHEIWSAEQNAIIEFQKFLSATGGHYGGWNELDHLLFLRERKKYKGKKKFLSAVHCLLPDLTLDDISIHEKWFMEYETLKNSQREAIQKWKTEKMSSQVKKTENLLEKKEINSVKKAANQSNIAERIRKWKEHQALKKLEEEERQREEKIQLKKEEQKKKEMLETKKLAIFQYKSDKLKKVHQDTQSQKDELQLMNSKIKKRILLKSFRLQDIKFMEKKKSIHLQLAITANEKMNGLKLPKPAIEYLLQRNPKRVFQPTLIWTQHCQQNDIKEKKNPVFNLNLIPRLAIPEWRKELK